MRALLRGESAQPRVQLRYQGEAVKTLPVRPEQGHDVVDRERSPEIRDPENGKERLDLSGTQILVWTDDHACHATPFSITVPRSHSKRNPCRWRTRPPPCATCREPDQPRPESH